jgi:hypothetical protein
MTTQKRTSATNPNICPSNQTYQSQRITPEFYTLQKHKTKDGQLSSILKIHNIVPPNIWPINVQIPIHLVLSHVPSSMRNEKLIAACIIKWQ